MPDFAKPTGETVSINQNVTVPTYYSNRLHDALVAVLDLAKEETGITSMKAGGEWSPGSYAFHIEVNSDETQPNKAGVGGFH
jgi:hypothetical protein